MKAFSEGIAIKYIVIAIGGEFSKGILFIAGERLGYIKALNPTPEHAHCIGGKKVIPVASSTIFMMQ